MEVEWIGGADFDRQIVSERMTELFSGLGQRELLAVETGDKASANDLARQFQPWIEHGLVKEGLGKIRAKFDSIDAVGPVWAAQFVGTEGQEFEIVQRDAFERVRVLLDELNIPVWKP